MGGIDERIRALETKRDEVSKQYTTSKSQARRTLNEADKAPLKEEQKELKRKYDELNEHIKRLKRGDPLIMGTEELKRFKADVRYDWEQKLHLLDFFEPEKKFYEIARVQNQNAALLLIQHGLFMKADSYIKRIHGILQLDKQVHPYHEAFSRRDGIGPLQFVDRWHDTLKIQSRDGSPEERIISVINDLAESITARQALCISIRVEQIDKDFLQWIMRHFWKALADKIQQDKPGARLVVVLIADKQAHNESNLDDVCCLPDNFDYARYLEIELHNWETQEISRWMNDHVNGMMNDYNLPQQNIGSLAETVYEISSQGIPLYAHNLIIGEVLSDIIVGIERTQNGRGTISF